MHTHNTFPNMAQKYKKPMWELPDYNGLDKKDKSTIAPNREAYENTKRKYENFADDFMERVASLDGYP